MAVEAGSNIKPVNCGEDIGRTEVPKESCFADQVLPRITLLLFDYTDELLMHQHPRKQWDGQYITVPAVLQILSVLRCDEKLFCLCELC